MSVEAYLRKELDALKSTVAALTKLISKPRSITEEIDAIQGRRIVYTLSGDQSFTSSQDGLRANPISMQVSQDGYFVMTHYPCITWYPNAPATATNLGRKMPIRSHPLPTQQNTLGAANTDSTVLDVIDISYEIADGGSQRNFQNLVAGDALISTADNMLPLPVPTLFQPNSTISVTITYHNILFGSANTVTTGGNLHVDLPGYKIVSM